MIFNDIINVFLTNFDDGSIKIKIEQFLNILIQECIDDFIEININMIKIFFKKIKSRDQRKRYNFKLFNFFKVQKYF
jgi:hypothetical protein